MNNSEFLQVIKNSFIKCLETSPRSNEKLKILHGAISKDINERLNDSIYAVQSLGFGKGKEQKIQGRYYNKAVDITIQKNRKNIAGIAVKFVMSNYSQNSNNYFENMLGETANIRSAGIPYYQIFIIPDRVPYFDNTNNITHWEQISEHNLSKYIKLSKDNTQTSLHVPNKTLVYIVDISGINDEINTRQEYCDYYLNNDFDVTPSNTNIEFDSSVIYNNLQTFAEFVTNDIKNL